MTQGERVNQIRKTLDLTLEKFGEKLGVQKSSISKIEKDRVALSDQMAKSICREYNVNYDYLMYGEGEMFDDLPQTIVDELCVQYELNDFDKALVEMYVSLPAGSRERIKEYMKQLVKKVGGDQPEGGPESLPGRQLGADLVQQIQRLVAADDAFVGAEGGTLGLVDHAVEHIQQSLHVLFFHRSFVPFSVLQDVSPAFFPIPRRWAPADTSPEAGRSGSSHGPWWS